MKSQNDALRAHLEAGKSITPLEAFGVYGIFRLAARIRDLRDAGLNIETRMRADVKGKQYAEYALGGPIKKGDFVAPALGCARIAPKGADARRGKVIEIRDSAYYVQFPAKVRLMGPVHGKFYEGEIVHA